MNRKNDGMEEGKEVQNVEGKTLPRSSAEEEKWEIDLRTTEYDRNAQECEIERIEE